MVLQARDFAKRGFDAADTDSATHKTLTRRGRILYNIRCVIRRNSLRESAIKDKKGGFAMTLTFPEILSSLRRARGLSQRKAAADLGISQALLSHYENGAREPGLGFVCRVCDYYGVTADYLLGRCGEPNAAASAAGITGELISAVRALMDAAAPKLDKYLPHTEDKAE